MNYVMEMDKLTRIVRDRDLLSFFEDWNFFLRLYGKKLECKRTIVDSCSYSGDVCGAGQQMGLDHSTRNKLFCF